MAYSNRYGVDEPVYRSDELVDDRSTRRVATMPWSPAQIIGLAVGIFFVALGAAAVLRTGIPTSHLDAPHDEMWSFGHSPLLGIAEIGYGALLVVASVVPGGARTLMGVLGAIGLTFGVVIVAGDTPARLHRWLAVTHRSGWLFVIAGAVVLLAGMLAPVFVPGARRREERHVEGVS